MVTEVEKEGTLPRPSLREEIKKTVEDIEKRDQNRRQYWTVTFKTELSDLSVYLSHVELEDRKESCRLKKVHCPSSSTTMISGTQGHEFYDRYNKYKVPDVITGTCV